MTRQSPRRCMLAYGLLRCARNDEGRAFCLEFYYLFYMDEKKSYIYILFNKRNGTLYTGVTSDLVKRVYEHKNKVYEGFTSKYGVDKLGYYEVFNDIKDAIIREKQIKSGSRKKKIQLIESINPTWIDLYEKIRP